MSNTIYGTTPTTNTPTAKSGSQGVMSNDSLGKDDFLKLLITQMQNQDPLNPADNKESIAQLAQFSSLEQMNNIAASMDALNSSMSFFTQQSALTQGAAMIGKWASGVDMNGETILEGTVEAVKWLDGDPKLQIRQADGILVDLEMGLLTLVKDQAPVIPPATNEPSESTSDGTDWIDDGSVTETEIM